MMQRCGVSVRLAVVALALVAVAASSAIDPVWYQPEQVHLSYGDEPNQMSVSWVTTDHVQNASYVEYGVASSNDLNHQAKALVTKFINIDFIHYKSNRTMWIYKATMTDLKLGNTYRYHVGSMLGWSAVYTFRTRPEDESSWSPSFLVYGDLGNENAQSIAYLQEEAAKGTADAILHIGDFAYDLFNDRGLVGDAFMKQIEPIAAYIPYMTCPGNHEFKDNFTQYKNRFNMPGKFDSMMYSMELGSAKIIMFNTEAYYKREESDQNVLYTQYRWLEEQLKASSSAEARTTHPWLIVMGHRPMYCSDASGGQSYDDCSNPENPIRVGLNSSSRAYSLEDLFYKYGVDLQFYAHEHSYERLFPLYKDKMCNGTHAPYTNPTGPVHIITGSAGDREGQTRFDKIPHAYSAFHTDDYGYTRLNILNGTHIQLEQVSTDKGGAVIDKITVIKDQHGAGTHTCHL